MNILKSGCIGLVLVTLLFGVELTDKITQNGVTWTFDKQVASGRFVNGDYYIVGPVTVINIDPKPENGRNGSSLNPAPNADKSGYDSRLEMSRYDPSMRAPLPVSMKPGDMLVSSISVEKVGEIQNWLKKSASHSPIKSYSVLTCLAVEPPKDAFRPSYADGYSKDMKLFLAKDLKRDLLPRLAYGKKTYKVEKGSVGLKELEDRFARTWLDILFFEYDTPVEYMTGYPAETARAVGIATLALMTDLKPEEKEKLLTGVVQYGIDLWGLIRAGYPGWPGFGGHGSARKWPIIFAGMLLGDEAMSAPNKKYPNAKFGEDMQTMYGNGWTGAKGMYAGHLGQDGEKYKKGWGLYENLQPKDWPVASGDNSGFGKGTYIGENYRRCCTSHVWVGEALAARLMQAEKNWGHPAFFDYVDRWMTEDDTAAIKIIKEQINQDYSADWQRQKRAWDPFVQEMWNKYRNNLPK